MLEGDLLRIASLSKNNVINTLTGNDLKMCLKIQGATKIYKKSIFGSHNITRFLEYV